MKSSNSMISYSTRAPRYSQSLHLSHRQPTMSSSSFILHSAGRSGGSIAGGGFGSGFGYATPGLSATSLILRSGGGVGGAGLVGDEKVTMQNLNDRLASYLATVQRLEQSNAELEKEIRELSTNTVVQGFDWSMYDQTIKPLQTQILEATLQNSQIALEIDNAKLAAEDFQNKWQTEQMLRQSVESDIEGLHHLKETYLQLQDGLTNDIAGLEDEIAFLKKNHNEELNVLRKQCTQEVNVEVDSAPGVDLNKVLEEMRQKYTTLVDNNQVELDKWYQEQLSIKEVQVTQNDQALTGVKTELSQFRHQVQTLNAEYNGLLGNINALESTLDQTEASYDNQLQSLQFQIRSLEAELVNLRNEQMRLKAEYDKILNIKMQLEAEISQYKCLLGTGNQNMITGGISSSGLISGRTGTGSSTITIKTTEIKENIAT
ncbi:keratin, type I cytoskeletal 19-like [Hypanus sabinus]|uniref:keratin, type I cytoskeletal 19-like n=1 Tax=Hypanus sabinus TaxID=79690 RepID=UPI0028C413B1|nr:keratin, type I cytoskeletal 19-like [Hypanus sabinus]